MLGRLVSARNGLSYLHRLGFTRQVPRPRHVGADWLAQTTFKARFRARMQQPLYDTRGRALEVWAFDEHRAGLKPVLRKIWAPCGHRPVGAGQHRFQWRYVSGFVRPSIGETMWFLADAVNTAMFIGILAAFARDAGVGTDKRVVLALDDAGWHIAADLVIPDGIELMFLPAYSPRTPAGRSSLAAGSGSRRQRALRQHPSLDQRLGDRCNALADDPDIVHRRTLFHWWTAFA